MASVKKFNGNLVIQTPFGASTNSNVTIDTDSVIITGNLTVRGNVTAIYSNTQVITDNIITLNAGETGNGVSTLGTTSGVEIDRGVAPGGNVRIIWNETSKNWENVKSYKVKDDVKRFYDKLTSRTIEIVDADQNYIYTTSNGNEWILQNSDKENDIYKKVFRKEELQDLLKAKSIKINVI